MRRLKIFLAVLALALLTTGGGNVFAATSGDTLPELAPLTTVRDTYLLSFNGQPLQVCQREWQSWNRVHGVCHDLMSAAVYDQRLIAGTVSEFVLFDGTRYDRVNDQTIWRSSPDEDFAPDRSLNEGLFIVSEQALLTRVGPTEVDGTAATQYQYWVLDKDRNAQVGGQLVYDMFLSDQNNVLKSQSSARGVIGGLGAGELTEVRTFSAFNEPVTVAPPPADQVQALSLSNLMGVFARR